MKYPIDKYKSQAAATFTRLVQTYSGTEYSNSWQTGNVFDTLTDYLFRYPAADPGPGAVLDATLDRWRATEGSRCWYDDYGWWGIASAKAFEKEYARIFGSTLSEFQGMAIRCWDVMHTGKPSKSYSYRGGPNVWDNRDEGSSPGYFSAPNTWAVPRYPGGVWQYDMWKDRRDPSKCIPNKDDPTKCSFTLGEDSWSNPSDPTQYDLGPFQLTVMNGLYLVLALRLKLMNQGTGTDESIASEMSFLKNWFYNAEIDDDHKLLWRQPDNNYLVRERVGTYAHCEELNTYPQVQGFQVEGAWGGDQGLILGGLLDYLWVEPSDPIAQSLANSIALGVLKDMVDSDGVLPYSSGFNYHGDSDDYSCGSGVFWRYLLRGFAANAGLRTELLNLVTADPEGNAIYKSAEGTATRIPPGNKLFADFNILATLTAAIEILQETGG